MLKKNAAISLLILYLVTVSGFALNLHYCFNRLSSIHIDAPAKNCFNVSKPGKMKCCTTKHIEVKVKDAHQNGSSTFLAKLFISVLPAQTTESITLSPRSALNTIIAYRGPPSRENIALHLKNCIFRI